MVKIETDLNVLYEEMDSEEKDMFYNHSATEYFHYVEALDKTQEVFAKLEGGIPLEEDDWVHIMTKLFIVGCRAEREREKMDLLTWLCAFVSRVGLKVFKKDRPFYIECLKMAEEVWAIKKEGELDLEYDLGVQITVDSEEESDLDILLGQCRENCVFRDNKDAFADDYINNSAWGYMGAKSRMYIHACHQSYERAHALYQQYKRS